MGQVTVFGGAQRRRRWSEAAKIDLVARAFAPRARLRQIHRALRRLTWRRRQHQAAMARHNMRETQEKRRERTKHLIELGGLVVKAGLVELTDDDRAALYGAFLDLAGRLRGEDRANVLSLWQRKGHRAFGTNIRQ